MKIKKEDLILIIVGTLVSLLVFLIFSSQSSFEKGIAAAIKSTVEISSSDSSEATGIIIKKGYVITNYHVVGNNNEKIQITGYDNKLVDAKLIAYDEKLDLAILSFKNNHLPAIKLFDSDKLTLGQQVRTIGNAKGYGLAINDGLVSSYTKIIRIQDVKREVIQISVPIVEGDSGGPIINQKGELVGMMSFKTINFINNSTESISFAIPSNIIKNFVDKNL